MIHVNTFQQEGPPATFVEGVAVEQLGSSNSCCCTYDHTKAEGSASCQEEVAVLLHECKVLCDCLVWLILNAANCPV